MPTVYSNDGGARYSYSLESLRLFSDQVSLVIDSEVSQDVKFSVVYESGARLTGGLCFYCGRDLRKFKTSTVWTWEKTITQWDHVVPVSRFGLFVVGNIVPACEPCNHAKSAKLAEAYWRERKELGLKLLYESEESLHGAFLELEELGKQTYGAEPLLKIFDGLEPTDQSEAGRRIYSNKRLAKFIDSKPITFKTTLSTRSDWDILDEFYNGKLRKEYKKLGIPDGEESFRHAKNEGIKPFLRLIESEFSCWDIRDLTSEQVAKVLAIAPSKVPVKTMSWVLKAAKILAVHPDLSTWDRVVNRPRSRRGYLKSHSELMIKGHPLFDLDGFEPTRNTKYNVTSEEAKAAAERITNNYDLMRNDPDGLHWS